jgi:hypothetical protein
MKKLLLIFAIALASCTTDEPKTECDCNAITTVNNVPNGESYYYGDDCSDDGKLLFEFYEPGFVSKRIVKCN